MAAYYNENNPEAAAWLRQLIKNGDIADGEVDERSILEVCATDIKEGGFTQHHFFAGVGVWSYALRQAEWPDELPVTSASLPCQPFSIAGNKKGKEDERHLLPHFLTLVRECNFNILFGEQVTDAIKHGWLDDLQTVMEAEDYAVGHCVLGAHSVNAAHQRQRLFWVADTCSERSQGRVSGWSDTEWEILNRYLGRGRPDCRVGNTEYNGCAAVEINRGNDPTILSDSERSNLSFKFKGTSPPANVSNESIEWIVCADNKYRPIPQGIEPLVEAVEPGTLSVDDGATDGMVRSRNPGEQVDVNNTYEARAMRIKGYGNAIVAGVATEFIEAFMETKLK